MTKKLPEKLRYTLQWIPWRQTKSVPDNKEIMDKINELIDYLTPEAPTDTEERGDWISEDILLWYVKETTDTFKKSNGANMIRCDVKRLKLLLDKHLPKPVEKELMPLDANKVTNEIFDNIPTPYQDWQMKRSKIHRIIKSILSKYWVHKQEEKCIHERWEDTAIWPYCVKCKEYKTQPTPTPQAISVKWLPTKQEQERGMAIMENLIAVEHRKISVEKALENIVWHLERIYTQATSVIDVEKMLDEIDDATIFDWDYWFEREAVRNVINKHLSSLPIQKKRSSKDIAQFVVDHDMHEYSPWKVLWFFLEYNWQYQD